MYIFLPFFNLSRIIVYVEQCLALATFSKQSGPQGLLHAIPPRKINNE